MSLPDAEIPPAPRSMAEIIFVRVPYILGGVLIFIAIAINFANVVGRYLFFTAVYWAEEVLVFLMIWGVFVVAVSITFQGAHIRMDLFSASMRSPMKEIMGVFTALLMFGCTAFVAFQSYRVVSLYAVAGSSSITANIPLTIPHSALMVGFTAIAVVALWRLPAYLSDRFERH